MLCTAIFTNHPQIQDQLVHPVGQFADMIRLHSFVGYEGSITRTCTCRVITIISVVQCLLSLPMFFVVLRLTTFDRSISLRRDTRVYYQRQRPGLITDLIVRDRGNRHIRRRKEDPVDHVPATCLFGLIRRSSLNTAYRQGRLTFDHQSPPLSNVGSCISRRCEMTYLLFLRP